MELFQQLLSAPFDFLSSYGLPFIGVLSLLVFVHEWGHYYAARKCGIRVEKFSIGFGREIFGRTDKNGTRWKFCLIPLGGYVQMFGDSDPASARVEDTVEEEGQEPRALTDEEKKVAFYAQPVWKRFIVVFAGPAINFMFAIVLLTGLYATHGQPFTPPVAAKILEDSPADVAGIQPDDRFITINGRNIEDFQDIVQTVSLFLDSELTVELASYEGEDKWSEETRFVKLTPELLKTEDRFGFIHSKGRIGIYSPSGKSGIEEHGVGSAFVQATAETYRITADTLKALGQMITGTRSADEIGGIIRIGAYAGEFAQAGWVAMLTFAALLSVNLGLINLFPIPLLDGGHLAFYTIEAVRGKPLNDNAQEYALRFGFAVVVSFMLFATWNDLVQLKVVEHVLAFIS